jgi:hypothetical protein
MNIRVFCQAALAFGAVGVVPAWAADPPGQPGQMPVVGQSAMGDKSRASPDGWAWAPVTRDRSAMGHPPGPGQAGAATAGQTQSAKLPAGDDPGTPANPQASGPGALDRSAAARKP